MHAYTYEAGLLSDTYVLCNMKLVHIIIIMQSKCGYIQ